MDIYESQRTSVIMIWNSTFLIIPKSNCNELWFTMTVCRHNNFFHITDSEILLLSVWMQKYINLFKDSILWLIIVLSFSLDRLESSVTNSHFFHWWSLKSCVEVEQCVIVYIYYYNNNLIQRVRSCQVARHGSSYQTSHIKFDDPRLVTRRDPDLWIKLLLQW